MAESMAQELGVLFTQVGFPPKIVMDQGTVFTKKTLKALAQLVGLPMLHTTVYHPQTNSLVERFNGTLKRMLKMFIQGRSRDWHCWTLFLLFAVWEVPQASLMHSPFKLLYGRHPRGIIDVVREQWEEGAPSPYVTVLREKFKQVAALAKVELMAMQEVPKRCYDTKVKP